MFTICLTLGICKNHNPFGVRWRNVFLGSLRVVATWATVPRYRYQVSVSRGYGLGQQELSVLAVRFAFPLADPFGYVNPKVCQPGDGMTCPPGGQPKQRMIQLRQGSPRRHTVPVRSLSSSCHFQGRDIPSHPSCKGALSRPEKNQLGIKAIPDGTPAPAYPGNHFGSS